MKFPKHQFERTVVLRRWRVRNPVRSARLKRVEFASPRFRRTFQAFGADQVMARVILNPAFMQHLLDLKTALSGRNIRFAFAGTALLIAVETSSQFRLGSVFKPFDDPAAVQRMLDEICTLYDIVEGIVEPDARRFVSSERERKLAGETA